MKEQKDPGEKIKELLKRRILILDGAMGTMIQRYGLTEEDYRGEAFRGLPGQLRGNNDMLSISKPDLIGSIHRQYLEAGADIIETNSFSSQSVSMADYGMQEYVRDLNLAAAKIARKEADAYTSENPDKPRFVAGSVGPTNKTASISPDVSDPAYRNITFDDLRIAFREQIHALIDGHVDLILIETCFDTINIKAALMAAEDAMALTGKKLPVMLSLTLAGKSGRILSGQTLGAVAVSVGHADLLSVGLNCSFGASEMKPFLRELGRVSPSYISAYPNAGLPNSLGEYDETPERMASQIMEYVDEGLVNILGGCCGTTPEHIAKYSEIVRNARPHIPSEKNQHLLLSGLDVLEIRPESNFINIGERCNVAGSKKFLRLIKSGNYEEALSVARKQVEDGAQILDINVDDGLLDGVREMTGFLNYMGSDPDIAKVPFMIDSSDWKVIEAGLKCVQGKCIVNSISLKSGEEDFIKKAKTVYSYGAAVIAMAFDEKGQADTFDRKIKICGRMYDILVHKAGFEPQDIIFDPNILAIATGMEEHANYALYFLQAAEWIKKNLPGAKVSGGISNLSFSFRGNNYLRECMHSVFLYHAIRRGMDMGIVNPSSNIIYDEIPSSLRDLIEEVIFNKTRDASERLIEYAQNHNEKEEGKEEKKEEWRSADVPERLKTAIIKGIGDYLESDLAEALKIYEKPIDIIDQPLMAGMNVVGDLFGSGKMFLPQVVKTARTMKKAVAILQPAIEATRISGETKAGKILMATVKGDVHDIGKNITGVVLSCNNYEIIDLGVMVPPEEIISQAKLHHVDMIGLSGLITPSLQEMSYMASELEKNGFNIPLLIGGATTSKLHTALKIDPLYHAPVIYVKDASQAVPVANKLMNSEVKEQYAQEIEKSYENLRNKPEKKEELVSYEYACKHPYDIEWNAYHPVNPSFTGSKVIENISIKDVIPYIDWQFFLSAWKFSIRYKTYLETGRNEEAKKKWAEKFTEEERPKATEAAGLLDDARKMLDDWILKKYDFIRAIIGFYPVEVVKEGISVEGKELPLLRQQEKRNKNEYKSLKDFFNPKGDYIGFFIVTAGHGIEKIQKGYKDAGDSYNDILMQTLCDRLAEATTEYLHEKVRKEYWGYAKEESLSMEEILASKYKGIRPACGYPSLPDISLNFDVDRILDFSRIGVRLTPNGAIFPTASVCGMYIAQPDSLYFSVGTLGEDQLENYAKRKNISVNELKKWLGL